MAKQPLLKAHEIAGLLERRKESILSAWEESAVAEVTAAQAQTKIQLRDSLPKFLDRLVLTLRSQNPDDQARTNSVVAREHGVHRASQPEYSLDEVIFEYHLLREAIVKVLSVEGVLDANGLAIIHKFIDEGIRKAVVEFVARQSDLEATSKAERDRDRQRLTAAVKVAKVGFFEWDIPGDLITFSDQMQRDWGIKADSSLKTVLNSIHPEDRDRVNKLISTAIEDHSPYATEYRVVRPDGDLIWIQAKGEVSYDPRGTPLKFVGTSLDITENKRMVQRVDQAIESEHALTMGMAQLEKALSVARVGFFNWNVQNDHILFSERMQSDWGIRADTPLAETIKSMHPADQTRVTDLIYKTVRDRVPYSTEYRVVKPDGSVIEIEAKGEVSYTEAGAPLEFTGTCIDVTARKRLEREYARVNSLATDMSNRQTALFEKAPFGLAIVEGPEHRFAYSNAYYTRAFLGEGNYRGLRLEDLIPDAKTFGYIQKLDEVFKTGAPFVADEIKFPFVGKDGVKRIGILNVVYEAIRDSSGLISGVLIFATDVTAQFTARQAISAERTKLEAMIDSSPVGIALLRGKNLVFEKVNARFAMMVGHRAYVGRPWQEVYRELPDSPLIATMHEVLETGVTFEAKEHRLTVQLGDGALSHRYFDFSYVRVVLDEFGDDGLLIQCADVTDRVSAAQRIEQASLEVSLARDEAERANTAKSAFLANMSHEIRTPLGAIMGFADLARDPKATSSEVSSYLGIVERNAVQVMRIIDDILDLAKVEAGRVELEKIEFSLASFLADFASLMGFRARENGIALAIKAETDLPELIVSDPTRLRQILTNAVGNAIKFTNKGSVTIHVYFGDGRLRFGIADTGRGITLDQSQNLFQAFAQADASTTRKYGGTGLGLVLTKRLCQLLGGDYVLVRSELGVGSKFDASIQVALSTATRILPKAEVKFDAVVEKEVSAPPARQLDGVTVLLVEDSPDNQFLIRLILERQGVKLDIASDGLAGVRMASQGDYDLVLMDIQMPVMDGREAAHTLRANGYQRPVVALTAHAMKEEAERAFEAGFTSYLTKPINRDALISTIRELAGNPA